LRWDGKTQRHVFPFERARIVSPTKVVFLFHLHCICYNDAEHNCHVSGLEKPATIIPAQWKSNIDDTFPFIFDMSELQAKRKKKRRREISV